MSVHFEQDKPIFVPFREGKSIFNSQGVPRIYKSVEAFRRWFPGHYLGDDGITLVEYAPVRNGSWKHAEPVKDDGQKPFVCSACGLRRPRYGDVDKAYFSYCPWCGTPMDAEMDAKEE